MSTRRQDSSTRRTFHHRKPRIVGHYDPRNPGSAPLAFVGLLLDLSPDRRGFSRALALGQGTRCIRVFVGARLGRALPFAPGCKQRSAAVPLGCQFAIGGRLDALAAGRRQVCSRKLAKRPGYVAAPTYRRPCILEARLRPHFRRDYAGTA